MLAPPHHDTNEHTPLIPPVLCVCGALAHLWINKFSTFAVLHTADGHQSRTLAILRQSLDSISFEEYTALFDRYTK